MIMINIPAISVEEFMQLQAAQDVFLLDVREPHEYEQANMGGYLIPLGELADRINEIDTAKPIVVHCRSGARSAQAVQLLLEQGIEAKNLTGGINAWHVLNQ
jgi:adenylyltransferase/sulfurtransferase